MCTGLPGSAVFVVLEHKQQNGEREGEEAVVYQVCSGVCAWCGSAGENESVLRGWGVSADVIGPCLSPWLMAIGHRLSPLYFFCSPAPILPGLPLEQRPQAPHHLLLSGVTGERRVEERGGGGGVRKRRGGGGGGEEGGTGRRCAAERSQWRRWGEAGTLDCQISAVEYLMEPGVFI